MSLAGLNLAKVGPTAECKYIAYKDNVKWLLIKLYSFDFNAKLYIGAANPDCLLMAHMVQPHRTIAITMSCS